MIIILILILTLGTSVFILYGFKEDLQNKKYFVTTYVITIVGTLSGVFLAATLNNYQIESKEKEDLIAILKQAHVEADSATYKVSTYLGSILFILNDKQPVSSSDLKKLKYKISNNKYDKAILSINMLKNLDLIDRLIVCETLYAHQLSSKYIFKMCRPLNYLLSDLDRKRILIKSDDISYVDRIQAIDDYIKLTADIDTVIKLSKKSLNSKLTTEEASKIEELAGFSQGVLGRDGKLYHASPIDEI